MHENSDFARLFRARPLRFVLPMKQPSADIPSEQNLIEMMHQSLESNRDSNGESTTADVVSDSDAIEYSVAAKHWQNEHRNALRKKPTAYRLPDGKILVKPELLCDVGCETPRINANFYLGREYRYFYAISCDMDLDNPGTVSSFFSSIHKRYRIEFRLASYANR